MWSGATEVEYSWALTQKCGTYYNHQEYQGSGWLYLKCFTSRAHHISEYNLVGPSIAMFHIRQLNGFRQNSALGALLKMFSGELDFGYGTHPASCLVGTGDKVAQCRN